MLETKKELLIPKINKLLSDYLLLAPILQSSLEEKAYMTEIVKNNSIKFDLLETGNGGTDQTDRDGVFTNLFGVIDTVDKAEMKDTNKKAEEIDGADMDITEIVKTLRNRFKLIRGYDCGY